MRLRDLAAGAFLAACLVFMLFPLLLVVLFSFGANALIGRIGGIDEIRRP